MLSSSSRFVFPHITTLKIAFRVTWHPMVFYVTVVAFIVTLPMNKFTSTIMDDRNMDEIIKTIIEANFDTFGILTSSIVKYCQG